MPRHFPPGVGDGWSKIRHRSFWREGEVLLEMIKAATWPPLSIESCLGNWPAFQRDLAEGRRKRTPRIKDLLS